MATSVGRWNGNDRETTYVSSEELSALIRAQDITAPGTALRALVSERLTQNTRSPASRGIATHRLDACLTPEPHLFRQQRLSSTS